MPVLLASPISLLNNARDLRDGLFAGAAVLADSDDVVALSFDGPLGHGQLDFIEFSPDFNLIVSDCFWANNGSITYAGEDWVRFNFCLDSNARFQFADRGDFVLRGAQLRMLHQPSGLDCAHHFAPGRSVCATISIKRAPLTRLIDTDLVAAAATDDGFFFRRFDMPLQAVKVVGELLAMPHRGALRRLHARVKSEELLVSVLSARPVGPESSVTTRLRDAERLRLRDVSVFLERHFADPPGVDELARRFAMNRNKLTYGFRELHGCSMGEYVARHRLDTAWRLLETSDQPVSSVAAKVGYSHVQSFSAAFRRHYGVAPSWVRRRSQ